MGFKIGTNVGNNMAAVPAELRLRPSQAIENDVILEVVHPSLIGGRTNLLVIRANGEVGAFCIGNDGMALGFKTDREGRLLVGGLK